jgi:hypothetical protein
MTVKSFITLAPGLNTSGHDRQGTTLYLIPVSLKRIAPRR